MDKKKQKTISKFMSLILRHQPQTAGIFLDDSGWVGVNELLAGMKTAGRSVTRETLDIVVRENDKQRFQFSDDGLRIRATQGHSVDVELGYSESTPLDALCHGTPKKFVEPIGQRYIDFQSRAVGAVHSQMIAGNLDQLQPSLHNRREPENRKGRSPRPAR